MLRRYAIVDPVERATQICSDKQATVIFFVKMVLCRDDNKEWGSTLKVKKVNAAGRISRDTISHLK
jgi:hypothetical protein